MGYVRPTLVLGTAPSIGLANPLISDKLPFISWSTISDGSTGHYAIEDDPLTASGNIEFGLGTKTTSAGLPQLIRSDGNVLGPIAGARTNFTGPSQRLYFTPLGDVDVQPNATVDPTVLSPGQTWFRSDIAAFRGYNGTAAVSFATGTVVSSFNGRTGSVTLTSGDVTTALGDANIAYTDVANTFVPPNTGTNTFKMSADGTQPAAVFRVSHATPTANIVNFTLDNGVRIFAVDPNGHLISPDTAKITCQVDNFSVLSTDGTTMIFAGVGSTSWIDAITVAFLEPGVGGSSPQGAMFQNQVRLGFSVHAGATGGVMSFSNLDGSLIPAPLVTFEFVEQAIGAGGTGVVTGAMAYRHRTNLTPSNGFGGGYQYSLDSSTTKDRPAAEDDVLWVNATDASRKARRMHYVYDTVAREVEREEASGSAAMKSWFGTAAVVQQNTTGTTQQTNAGVGTAIKTDSTTTGGVGSTAYTVADIVLALKNYGLLAS